jgi:hypothetical protein
MDRNVRSLLQHSVTIALYATIAIGALAGVVLLQRQRLAQTSLLGLTPHQQEQQEIFQMSSMKYLPTQGFGFNNLLADWAFLRFLQYSGDDPARAETGYNASPAYFEVISKRDPRFLEPYLFASGTIAYELGQPERSLEILQRGIDAVDPRLHAGAHRLWVMRGMDYLLLLNNPTATRQSYEKAAEWAALSPDPDDRKEESIHRRIAGFLATDPDSRPVRFWAWNTIFAQAMATRNHKTQARAKQELLAMGATEAKDEKTGVIDFQPPVPVKLATPTASPTATPLPPRPLPSPKPEATDAVSPP